MKIALIAHDKKKEDMIAFVTAYQPILAQHELYATGTTGLRIQEATGLHIHRFQSGPYGGDQEIGAMIARNEIDMVIFLRDPLTAQPRTGCERLDSFMRRVLCTAGNEYGDGGNFNQRIRTRRFCVAQYCPRQKR